MGERSGLRELPGLFRLSIAFTPLADVLTGYALAVGQGGDIPAFDLRLAAACGASMAAFCFGTSLNDYVDRHRDKGTAPGRPLPSGRLSPGTALGASITMGAGALLLALLAGWQTLAAMAVVLSLILVYNLAAKKYAVPGVLILGSIRGADLLVGVTVADISQVSWWSPGLGFLSPGLVVLLYALYGVSLSTLALAEGGDRKGARPLPAWTAASLALLLVFTMMGRKTLVPACFIWAVLALPIFKFFEQGRKDAEYLVGHLVAGFFLVGALITLGLDHPWLCLFLWILYFISRALARRFPPA